jgi:hypothetical protein
MKDINLSVLNGRFSTNKYPAWFSSGLKTYIKNKNYIYRRYKKLKADCFYHKLSFYRKLVKTTIKSDRTRWLHSVDENLKSHPQQFWKYVSQYRKKHSDATNLDVYGVLLQNPRDIAEAFSEHFRSVYVNRGSRDSSVGMATSYGLDDGGVGVRVPVGSRIFTSPNRPDRL